MKRLYLVLIIGLCIFGAWTMAAVWQKSTLDTPGNTVATLPVQ